MGYVTIPYSTETIIEACVAVLDTIRFLVNKAQLDFKEFMADKWHLFENPEPMVSVQMLSFEDMMEFFCRDSNTEISKKMMQFVETFDM